MNLWLLKTHLKTTVEAWQGLLFHLLEKSVVGNNFSFYPTKETNEKAWYVSSFNWPWQLVASDKCLSVYPRILLMSQCQVLAARA